MNEQTVRLNPLTRKDLDDFWEWASDDEVTKTLMWESYTNKADAEKYLIDIAEKHPWCKAIYYHNSVVGAITLDQGKSAHSCKAELGYVIAKKYWGKGIGTSAVKMVLEQGFKDLNIQRIESYIDPDNIASQRVLEKNGFKNEELLKNHIKQKGKMCDRYLYAVVQD